MRTGRALLAGLVAALVVVGPVAARVPEGVADARRDIRSAIDEGRFADAERQARALLESLGGLTGEHQPDAMSAADVLLDALVENGRGADQATQDLARDLLRRRQSALPMDQRALATASGRLGAVLFQAGDYRLAAAELDKARSIRDAALVGDDAATVTDFEYLTLALLQVGQLADGLSASNRAVAIAENIGQASTPRALSIRGWAYLRTGEYSGRADLERAFAVNRLSVLFIRTLR
jgi:tetratricopeptide (TPR) repeat protein